jgi:hypothetical protein
MDPRSPFARFIQRFFIPIAFLIAIVLLGVAFELGRYTVYQAHPELTAEDQAAQIFTRVSALIQLPQDETPQISTINDAASAMAEQPFLTNAENGDVLIVYSNAGEALLYRPSTDKLIAVGPVDNSSQTQNAPRPVSVPVATTTNESTSTSKQ